MTTSQIPPVVQEKAFAMLADDLEKAGLRIEDNFRVSDEGMALTHAAVAVMRRTGFPMAIEGNASLEGMGLDRTNGFWHPLSEMKIKGDRELVNLWASASLFVSAAMGWIEGESASPKAAGLVTDSIAKVAPNVSVPALMKAARYSDADLLRLVALTHDGLEGETSKAFNKS